MELGERISGWLQARRKSRRELAEYCGVTTSAVCLWVGKGDKHVPPSYANMEKIVAFFGLTMVEFYGDVPPPATKVAKVDETA